ncbi:MAG: TraR/DksA C4-type zinc finger protein [Candidatus Colwellbacteria bacterium]|nr:TraR/DksA C4-type zinc finger protein [Candidatus Colwellbacteria bacterium]
MIRQEKLKELARLLKQDRDRIKKELATLKNDEFGDTPGLDNEEADETEEASNTLATVQVLEERLLDIEAAIKRIDDGTYGHCTQCRTEISDELLEAMPESSLCKDCKAV